MVGGGAAGAWEAMLQGAAVGAAATDARKRRLSPAETARKEEERALNNVLPDIDDGDEANAAQRERLILKRRTEIAVDFSLGELVRLNFVSPAEQEATKAEMFALRYSRRLLSELFDPKYDDERETRLDLAFTERLFVAEDRRFLEALANDRRGGKRGAGAETPEKHGNYADSDEDPEPYFTDADNAALLFSLRTRQVRHLGSQVVSKAFYHALIAARVEWYVGWCGGVQFAASLVYASRGFLEER